MEIWRHSFVICWNVYLKNMADWLEEQNTIMLLITMVTEAKENCCIFVPGLSFTVRQLLLLKCSYPDHQQQATSDSKLTNDLAASTDAAKVRVSATSEWTRWKTDGRCAYAHTSLVCCVIWWCVHICEPLRPAGTTFNRLFVMSHLRRHKS